jgi:hypothetical protein
MKKLLLCSIIFIACKATSPSSNYTAIDNNSTAQVFIADQTKGLPGKCYQRTLLNDTAVWTEVLCPKEITKKITREIHSNLKRLGYTIDPTEVSKIKIGDSTKEALIDFQKQNGLSYGSLDRATVNTLKSK